MKILVVHPSVELYGADKILLYILGFLEGENEITVLLPKGGVLVDCIKKISSAISIVIDESVPIVHSRLYIKGFLRLPFLLYRINKLFGKNTFDCVYCNTLATVLFLYTRWAKVKIIHVHEIIENRILNFGFSMLIRMKTKNAICVSEHVKDNLLFSKQYVVLHNGIPDLCGKSKINYMHEKLKFVLPGRYMPKKGQWFLIDALNLIPKKMLANAEFCLYGSPPPATSEFEELLKRSISNAGLDKTIVLHGFKQNIAEIYESANVLLIPSLMADPFPTTVLEAMMFSKPVIITNNGGASEIVKDSFGIQVQPNDIKSLSEAIIYFIENKDSLERMGMAARKAYELHLTIEIFKKNFISVMNSFMQKNGDIL